jgi:hypothetical protein
VSSSGGVPALGYPTITNLGSSKANIRMFTANQAAAANAAATASLANAASRFTYVTQVCFVVGFAAAVVELDCTLTNINGVTWTFPLIGGTAGGAVLNLPFNPPLVAVSANNPIVATIPASGAAGPAISVMIAGYDA